MKQHILFVDDEQPVLDALRRMLHPQQDTWEMTYINRPETAWEQLLKKKFDTVVADIKMSGMSGLELLERIRQTQQTKDIPVVMLTGLSDRDLKRQALELGAADLLNKPVEPEDLVARIRSVLRLKATQDELREHNQLLERKVLERTVELLHSRLDIIWQLGTAAEYPGKETGNHVIRVGCISQAIAEAVGMDREFSETLFLAAPLHDIGKIGVLDGILLKDGPLTQAESAAMQQHCLIGARILRENPRIRAAFLQWRGVVPRSDSESVDNSLLEMAISIALTHHEKWDGTGYPQELAGEKIPVESRIVAISDVFESLTSKRPLGEAYTEDKALEIIHDGAGKHFDPDVYAGFMEALPQLRSIRERFADGVRVFPEPKETEDKRGLVLR